MQEAYQELLKHSSTGTSDSSESSSSSQSSGHLSSSSRNQNRESKTETKTEQTGMDVNAIKDNLKPWRDLEEWEWLKSEFFLRTI